MNFTKHQVRLSWDDSWHMDRPHFHEDVEILLCLSDGGDFICLVKPQFEVGRSNIGKGGIVKSEKARNEALNAVIAFSESIGFKLCASMRSPIEGGDGNIEFLIHLKKPSSVG